MIIFTSKNILFLKNLKNLDIVQIKNMNLLKQSFYTI